MNEFLAALREAFTETVQAFANLPEALLDFWDGLKGDAR